MNIVAIPTLEAPRYLVPMLEKLLADPACDLIYVLDNGLPHGKWLEVREAIGWEPRVMLEPCGGYGLYRMWNHAWDLACDVDRASEAPAKATGDPYLLFANDDLIIPDGLVGYLAGVLDADPDLWLVSPDYQRPLSAGVHPGSHVRYVTGVQRHGGVAGWCMMLRAGTARLAGVPPVDERFKWWCGDDDLAFAVEAAGGRLGVLDGVPLEHPHETTARNYQWTHDAKEADMLLCYKKWGR